MRGRNEIGVGMLMLRDKVLQVVQPFRVADVSRLEVHSSCFAGVPLAVDADGADALIADCWFAGE